MGRNDNLREYLVRLLAEAPALALVNQASNLSLLVTHRRYSVRNAVEQQLASERDISPMRGLPVTPRGVQFVGGDEESDCGEDSSEVSFGSTDDVCADLGFVGGDGIEHAPFTNNPSGADEESYRGLSEDVIDDICEDLQNKGSPSLIDTPAECQYHRKHSSIFVGIVECVDGPSRSGMCDQRGCQFVSSFYRFIDRGAEEGETQWHTRGKSSFDCSTETRLF